MGKNNGKYSNIRSLSQLDKALDELNGGIRGKSELMKANYDHAKSFYTPANLFNYAVDKISPMFNLTGLALELYDRVREDIDAARLSFAVRREKRRAARESAALHKSYVEPDITEIPLGEPEDQAL
ncbi:MAG: hypothetical protein IKR30_00035 [Bacteroidales bacterium]|nr:hypothetical protein [Bacteroidales bacterium]